MEFNWDVFISYASEDKDEVARPIAILLQNFGLKVWFDEFEISLGSNWVQKIDRGLAKSKYGIFIISPNFVHKNWPEIELDTFFAMVQNAAERILPIRHEISQEEVNQFRALLRSIQNTSTEKGLDNVAKEVMAKVRPNNAYYNIGNIPIEVKPNALRLSYGEWHIAGNNEIFIQNLSDSPVYAIDLAYSIESEDLTLGDIKIGNPNSSGFSLGFVGNKGQTQIKAIPAKGYAKISIKTLKASSDPESKIVFSIGNYKITPSPRLAK